MPPKATLVKDVPRSKKSIPIKPLTTQGKIEKAKRQAEKTLKNQPRAAPAETQTLDPDAENIGLTGFKKAKAKSFAPPAETAEFEQAMRNYNTAAAKRAILNKDKWGISRGKPLTTQQKEAQARAAQASKGGVDAKTRSGPALLKHGAGRNAVDICFGDTALAYTDAGGGDSLPTCQRGKQSAKKLKILTKSLSDRKQPTSKQRIVTPKPQGLMKVLAQQDRDALPMTRPICDESVLIRPTQRAIRDRQRMEGKPVMGLGSKPIPRQPIPRSAMKLSLAAQDIVQKDGKSLLDLPEEIRTQIWTLSVIDPRFPIWPAKSENREQPDLAMTCRQIRAEVLPIYYAGNTFAVNLVTDQLPKPVPGKINVFGSMSLASKQLTDLAAVGKWARILQDPTSEGGRWFGMIRTWAFDYQDSASASEEGDFLVSLRFERPPVISAKSGSTESSSMSGSGLSSSPKTEVHHFAACIMPGFPECGRCVVPANPSVLNDAIIRVLAHGGLTAHNLVDLAREIRSMAEKLSSTKCARSTR